MASLERYLNGSPCGIRIQIKTEDIDQQQTEF